MIACFLVVVGPLSHRIVLGLGGIEVHQGSEVTLSTPRAAVASLRFAYNQLSITTVDGVTMTIATPWYTGRQRDVVIAHLRTSPDRTG